MLEAKRPVSRGCLCHQLAVRLLPLFLELLILIAALVVGLPVSQVGFELRLSNTGWSSLMALLPFSGSVSPSDKFPSRAARNPGCCWSLT